MRRIVLLALLLGLVLAPLQTLGVLRRGSEEVKEFVRSPKVQEVVGKFKVVLPEAGERVSGFISRLFPGFDIGVKEVR